MSKTSDPIVIVSAKRTAIGSFQGQFQSVPATELGSVAIKAAVDASSLEAKQVDQVIMGLRLSER